MCICLSLAVGSVEGNTLTNNDYNMVKLHAIHARKIADENHPGFLIILEVPLHIFRIGKRFVKHLQ